MSAKPLAALAYLLLALLIPSSAATASRAIAPETTKPAAIRVAIDDNYPPYVFRGTNGELQGYLVDFWRLWEQRTGVEAVLLASDWHHVQESMASGAADVLETAFVTPQREKLYDFLPPYVDVPVGIYAAAEIGGITDVENLRGFQVGVKTGDACAEHLRGKGIASLLAVESYEALIRAALSEKIKVFCLDEPPASYLLYRDDTEHRFRKAFTLYNGQLHRAVRKGDQTTFNLVQRGVDAIPANDILELEKKWKGYRIESSYLGRYVGWILVAALAAAALLALWTALLKRQVRSRTTELDAERLHLQTLIETIPDAIWLKDTERTVISCNPAYAALVGRSVADVIGAKDYDLFPSASVKRYQDSDQRAISEGRFTREETYRGPDDVVRRFEITKTPIRNALGETVGVLGIAHDITERERNRDALQRSLRSMRLLSDTNQILIRCESEEELLGKITTAIVAMGGYVMAWVGYARDDADKTVEPVAQSGFEDGYLATRHISWGDGPWGQTVSGRAIRARTPMVNRDYTSEEMRPWREEALRRGYRSSIALPLVAGDDAYGVLNIYSAAEDAFSDDEVTLLAELAGDLAFGISTLRQRRGHKETAAALRGQKEVLELVATGAPLASVLTQLILNLEAQISGMRGSILLADGNLEHLNSGVAPSLPEVYAKAVDGIPIADGVGCCGTAAARRAMVIVEDIATDPLWQDFRDLALAHNLSACWSTPFFDPQGGLLGTLAFYFGHRCRPGPNELRLMDLATHTAGIAVTRQREEEALRRSETSLAAAQALARLGNWEIDLASGRIYWSSEMFRLYYLQPSANPPSIDEQRLLIHPDDWAGRRETWKKLKLTGASQEYEFRTHPNLGPVRYLSAIIQPVIDDAGVLTSYVGTLLDVTERKAQEAQIERLAFYDPLTGLPHRALFIDRLQQALSTAERRGSKVALLFLDLDRFKEINDSQGHQAGDKVLIEVGHRLQGVLRHDETLARLGGDEFTVIVRETEDSGAALVAQRIQSAFVRPFTVSGRIFTLGVSIGIAIYPEDGDTAHLLLSRSDIAMYQAKSRGGGYHFYRPEMSVQLDSRLSLAQGLERAIAENRLQLYYQPQVRLADNQLVGAEALLRWKDDARGWISPAEFIPVAEDRGMMDVLGAWVIREAARQLKSWEANGTPFIGTLAINVSPKQLGAGNFITTLRGIVEAFGINPRQIELELTESALMIDAERAVDLMARLKELGFALAIDDFGTGYSSLVYLKRFPADKLKIDMSFVRDMLTDHNDYAIVTTIIAMAKNLGLATIAEGVEAQAQADALLALGCAEVQGYLFGAPVAPEAYCQRWLGGTSE